MDIYDGISCGVRGFIEAFKAVALAVVCIFTLVVVTVALLLRNA